MHVTPREVIQHFRTNPISTLVAVLLLLLFGLVLRVLFHIDVEMHRDVLVHDEVQHLQIKEAYLNRQLQGAITDVRQYAQAVDYSDSSQKLHTQLQALCDQNSHYARVWLLVSNDQLETTCEGFEQYVDTGTPVSSSAVAGVELQLIGAPQSELNSQYIRMALPVTDEQGQVKARWLVDFALKMLPDASPGEHRHGVAQTMLMDTAHPWRGDASILPIAKGAGRLSAIKLTEAGIFQNEYGMYLAQPVRLTDPKDRSLLAGWRMLSWVPAAEFEHHRHDFLIHAAYVLLGFVMLISAMFFYSRRIIREQTDNLTHLNNQRIFLDGLLNSSSDGMLTLMLDGEILSCNTRAESLFGFRPGQLVGRSVEHLLPSDYQTSDQDYAQIYQRLQESGEDYCRQELVGVRADGEDFPVEVTYCQLRLKGDERLLLTVREITERKVAQQELDNLRLQYFQQEKMAQIGLLMAGILHEVGNPIAAIQGLLEEVMAEDEARDNNLLQSNHRENIALVLQQANRIRTISQDVSGFASPNQSERGWLSLNTILESTVKLLGYDKRWRAIALTTDLDPQLPAIEGVSDQLIQVFMNLLVNAADACEGLSARAPQLLVASQRLAEGVILVRIRDNGSGIDEQVMMAYV